MKEILLLFIIPSFLCVAQQPIYQWSHTFADEGSQNYDDVNIIAIEQDQNGDIITLGWFNQQLVVDPTSSGSVSIGDLQDNYGGAFLAKYTKNGSLVWLKALQSKVGSFLSLRPVDLKLGSDGSIVVYGRYLGSCDFDPDENAEHIVGSGSGSAFTMFILKLDNDATFDWVKSFEYDQTVWPSNWYDIVPTAIELDLEDNIYAVGQCTGRVDFDPDPIDTSFAHLGNVAQNRAFMLKLTSDGDFVWKQTYGSHYQDELTLIKRGIGNDLFFGCVYHDSIHITVAGQDVLLDHPPGFWYDDEDFFMAKMDTSGQIEWFTRIVGYGDQQITDVQVDDNGEIYACGSFRGSMTLNPFVLSTYVYTHSNGSQMPYYSDGFLIKYASHGAPIWGTIITSKDSDEMVEIEITDDDVFVAGSVGDSLHVGFDFLGYSDFPSTTYFDDDHAAFLKFSKEGQCEWVQKLESNGYSRISDFVINGNDIFSTGNFGYDIDFDPSVKNDDYQMAYGGTDGFLHKMIFTADTFNVSQYAVYPNPFNDLVNLYVKDFESTQVTIFDMQGCLFREIELKTKITAIDLSENAAGVYVLVLKNGEKRESVRIVKQ